MSDSLQPHRLQHARFPCPSPAPGAYSNSCPLSWWCHPTILSSVVPFSSCLQSFPASWSFPVNQLFTSGGQSIGASVSASVLTVNIQGWFHLGLTGLISLLSTGLSRVFFNTIVQKHPFFSAQLSLWSISHISTCLHIHTYTYLLLGNKSASPNDCFKSHCSVSGYTLKWFRFIYNNCRYFQLDFSSF